MTQIFLLRHGEAEGNLYRRAQGQIDSDLTPNGWRQVRSLGLRFAGTELSAVYSSDLRRALETARAAAGDRLDVVTDPRLREMGFGVWENRPWGEINRTEIEKKTLFLTDPDAWHVEGSERFSAVQDRMEQVMTEIARRHEGGSVAVASHGMAIRAFLARIRGVPSREIAAVPLAENASVTLLRWEDGRFTTVYANDISHLPEPPFIPIREAAGNDPDRSFDLRYEPFDTRGGRERYLACYRDAWRIAHGTLAGFNGEMFWRGALLRAKDSPAALTAAYRGEDFAGVLALDERRGAREGAGWIAFLYVMPAFRGHRCGMQLLGAAVARYRELGRRLLRLTVAPGNPALGFYEAAGFVRRGTEQGALEPLLVMEKAI